ncbi:TetR/AcrR family transcriptional regulator [Paenibacillus daejeonensis]|uniref:TetR/AcrR family transcriptional regulator n=1 Tax=Paenibacillus daejeonensis TaxID=135193 RepID=UPI000379FE31|nr:TetR/AcrR family transcriptional regulator [Paenibacillus daejeonensis]
MNRQEQRSEETKQFILKAARGLFASMGYESVTIRQIAKAAGCSHTTIYIYFKDKEALLQALTIPGLLELQASLESILNDTSLTGLQAVKRMSSELIRFCLMHRTMYTVFFMVKADRVDEREPAMDMNKLRNQLFALLSEGLGRCFDEQLPESRLLAYSRIYYYMLQGIVSTYAYSEESTESLMGRLGETFDEATDVVLSGLLQRHLEEGQI